MFSADTTRYINKIRNIIIRILVVSTIVFCVIWNYAGQIISALLNFTNMTMMTVSPLETIQTELKVSAFCSIIVLLPYILFEVYYFIAPAMYENEKLIFKYGATSFYCMFVFGATVFAYVFAKLTLFILATYNLVNVNQSTSLFNYVQFLISISIACGVLMCIPNVTAILTYLGIINSSTMTTYRKHFIVLSLLISAIVTPGTDVFSMLLMEVPVLILFELSIIMSKIIQNIKVRKCSVRMNC
jgi:sec-independent protein translocase protein TatC